MPLDITFPGNVAIEANLGNFTIRTDQPLESGGENSAPSPFDLFLAALGTCAGYYALRFCKEREMDTSGLKLELETEAGTGTKKLEKVSIKIHLPDGFPEKYRQAIVRATEQCSVKRVIMDPPDFEIIAI